MQPYYLPIGGVEIVVFIPSLRVFIKKHAEKRDARGTRGTRGPILAPTINCTPLQTKQSTNVVPQPVSSAAVSTRWPSSWTSLSNSYHPMTLCSLIRNVSQSLIEVASSSRSLPACYMKIRPQNKKGTWFNMKIFIVVYYGM